MSSSLILPRGPCSLRNFCILASLLITVGCSDHQTAELVETEGVVKIDGKPAGNILVMLYPEGDHELRLPSSSGVSNENGEFSLTASDGRIGAVWGSAKVTLVDLDDVESDRTSRSSEQEGVRDPTVEQQETVKKPKRLPIKFNTIGRDSPKINVSGEPIIIDVRG